MPILPNGDVIASFLMTRSAARSWDGGVFDEVKLLRGEVKDIIYPDDKRSRSKRSIEYVVFAQRNANYARLTQEYRCTAATAFGGVADKLHYTLRPDTSESKKKEAIGKGSKVVFLCIDGEKLRGIILTGVRDDNDDAGTDDKSLGHNLYFRFNGLSAFIDDDGELVVTFNGKQTVDGKLDDSADKSAPGSTLKFAKDGAVQIADKDAKNAVTIDHANHKVKVAREAFEIGSATDKMLLGESFRREQSKLNKQLKQLIQQAGIQLSSAVDSTGAPVVGAQAAGALLQAASQAIDAFETAAGANNDFLSDKDKLGNG